MPAACAGASSTRRPEPGTGRDLSREIRARLRFTRIQLWTNAPGRQAPLRSPQRDHDRESRLSSHSGARLSAFRDAGRAPCPRLFRRWLVRAMNHPSWCKLESFSTLGPFMARIARASPGSWIGPSVGPMIERRTTPGFLDRPVEEAAAQNYIHSNFGSGVDSGAGTAQAKALSFLV